MTHSDSSPSSIRDDSICESSLPPNKSSGDIVERLKAAHANSQQRIVGSDIFAESAAEIERLRREVELTGEHFSDAINSGQIWRDRALTSESAVAAAWEEAAKIADKARDEFQRLADGLSEPQSRSTALICMQASGEIASAIRAAVSKKTAESGHSPPTHNSESE